MITPTAMHSARRPAATKPVLQSAVRGFTLIELMVTIAIMTILMAVAAPPMIEVVLGNRLASYANNLVASVSLARSEAIKRNMAMMMCVSSNGTSCTTGGWEQGWIVACNTTNNIDCDAAGTGRLVLRRQPAATNGLKITDSAAATTLSFDPSGVGATSASFKICRATPSVGAQERLVVISATGRAYASKTATASCP